MLTQYVGTTDSKDLIGKEVRKLQIFSKICGGSEMLEKTLIG